MKNTQTNTIRVEHCGRKQYHNPDAAQPGIASVIVNLREREQSLEVMGKPAQVRQVLPGDRIMLADALDCVVMRGTSLMTGDAVLATDLNEVSGVHRVGNLLVVLTPERWLYFRRDDENAYVQLNIDDAVPQLHLTELDESTITANVQPYTFATPYRQWQAPLNSEDVRALGALAKNAWNTMRNEAAEAGRLSDMTLARYGVRLHDDSYLWLSAPVLLGERTLVNTRTTANVTVENNAFTGIERSTMSLNAYRIGIHVVDGIAEAWKGLVKSVDLLISKEAPTRFATGSLDYRCTTVNTASGRSYEFEYTLPSRNRSAILADMLNDKWTVVASTTDFDGLAHHAFNTMNVTRSAQTQFEGINAYAVQTMRLDNSTLSIGEAARVTEQVGKYHLATCSMVYNDTLYCGGGSVSRRYRWSALPLFRGLMSRETTEVTTQITINTPQGPRTWLRTETLDYCPDNIAPFIAVHNLNATHIIITTTTGGNTRHWEGELAPLHRHAMAAFISPSLTTLPFTEGEPTVDRDAVEVITEAAEGHISTSLPGNALVNDHSADIFGGNVRWLATAGQPLYNGGFGRYPIYVFTSNGIFALPQNANGSYGEARLVNHRVASDTVAPVAGDDCVWFLTNYGSICTLQATKVIDRVDYMDPTALAWSTAKHELLALQTDKSALVLMPSGNFTYWRINADSFYADNVTAWAVDADGKVLDLNVEQPATMPVRYFSQPIPLDGMYRKHITAVTLNICGEDIDATFELNGEKGINSADAPLMHKVNITGSVNAPLRMPIYCPPVKRFQFLISGTLKSGSLLRPSRVEWVLRNTPYFHL